MLGGQAGETAEAGQWEGLVGWKPESPVSCAAQSAAAAGYILSHLQSHNPHHTPHTSICSTGSRWPGRGDKDCQLNFI